MAFQLFGKTLELGRELGYGNMGLAYLAKDSSGKKYVLKISNSEHRIKRHEYELNLKLGRAYGYAQAKRNPINNQIADIILLDYIPGEPVNRIVDEYLEDAYLSAPYRGFSSGLARNLVLALRMIETLEHIIDCNIFHDDLHLGNFLAAESENDFEVNIIDFGLGKDLSNADDVHERKNSMIQFVLHNLVHHRSPILPQEMYDSLIRKIGPHPSINKIKGELQKLLAKENLRAQPVAVIPPAPAPVLFNNQYQRLDIHADPQGYLSYCIQHGQQIGILKALKNGAILTPDLINKVIDANYKRLHPKSHAVLAQVYLEYCIYNGLQIGAQKALLQGAKLTSELVNILEHASYRRKNPKTCAAMKPYVESYYEMNQRAERFRVA